MRGNSRNFITILLVTGVGLAVCTAAGAENFRPRPSFRVLYNNDLTNVTSVDSPYHKNGEPFAVEKLYGSIDETANIGIDADMLQPGYGWVPCWKSAIYPYAQHVEWLMERYGTVPRFFSGYNAENITGEFLDRCRKNSLAAFISLRMNDYHHKNYVDFTKEEFAKYRNKINRKFELKVSKLYMEHPVYRLNDSSVPMQGSMDLWEYVQKYDDQIRRNNLWNWAIPEVRQYKLDFITEICENYDIDGFELDFMRHPWLFKKDFPEDERLKIMSGYIRQVRGILDRTARNGKHCWLSARVPSRISQQRHLGVDVKAWYEAGVDMFNLAPEYRMEQQTDLAKIHEAVPDAPLYAELTHTIFSIYRNGRSSFIRIMPTPEQYYTAAHLAYSRGAAGITAYNFAYYRWLGEPPFEIFKILHEPDLVAQQPQHYYLSEMDYAGRTFSQKFTGQFDKTFSIDMAPPKGGWTKIGKLRIAVEPSFEGQSCSVFFNGVQLKKTSDTDAPYPTRQPVDPKMLCAWNLPESLVKDGVNQIRIDMPQGEGELRFLDIGIR